MAKLCASIAIVAPACRVDNALADHLISFVKERYGAGAPTLFFHPQCFLSEGHFAGSDSERTKAFVDVANNTDFDAVWFARGGYGAGRLDPALFGQLSDEAHTKTYIGYSDLGVLLGRLYKESIGRIVHGAMPSDIKRAKGGPAIGRVLDFLVNGDEVGLEPNHRHEKRAAFNITVLSHMVGTPYEPDLSGHILMLEDVAEYHYRLDRSLFTIFNSPKMRNLKGVMLGRCSDIPDNDPAFEKGEVEIVQDWCAKAAIPYLGRADIGHDADNKVVVFGA